MPSHQWVGAPDQWTLATPRKPSSTTKRISSVLLVGAAVTGGIAGTADAASASPAPNLPQGQPTTQSMNNPHQVTVKPNTVVKFGGTLSSHGMGLANQPVDLEWRVGNGSWHVGAHAKSDPQGRVVANGQVSTSSQWRFSYAGNSLSAAADSPTAVVNTQNPQPPVGQRIVAAAAAQKGKPYRYGATGPNSFDCSGLTQFAYHAVGINLPRTSAAQAKAVRAIPRGSALPGDLIFFASGGHVYHAAIYAGNGMMWTAPQTGDVVKLQKIFSSSYTVGRGW